MQEQVEEFKKFMKGEVSEIKSSYKIAQEPNQAAINAAGITGAFKLAEDFNKQKLKDEKRSSVVEKYLNLLITEQDKLRIINLLLQEQNTLKEEVIPNGDSINFLLP